MRTATLLVVAALTIGAWAADNAAVGARPTATPQSTHANYQPPIVNPQSPDAITIPQMLSYQGKLTDSLGDPVPDDTYSLTFRLYAVPTGGTPFWNETQGVQTRGGIFSVLLGAMTPIGSVPDAGAAYLGMAVAGGPELTPRVRIVSAAYAYSSERAANADLLQGKDTTGFVRTGQTGSVTSAMIVNGTVAAADLDQMGASTGQLMKWTGSVWAPRNDSVGGGTGDNAWVRSGSDSVLYTINQLGIARGGSNNALYGSQRFTHVNLGVQCTTGTSGQNHGYVTVGGGYGNTASGNQATVGGGEQNTASGDRSTVSGGEQNAAGTQYATVSGGVANDASGSYATVGGGYDNTTNGSWATVGGGRENDAINDYATVGGGYNNSASAAYATVGGGYGDTAMAYASGVLSGYGNQAGDAVADSGAVVAGGRLNRAMAKYAAVGGGHENTASDSFATVAGGDSNNASSPWTTVAGGSSNTATGIHSAVLGGAHNNAAGQYSVIGGGTFNYASYPATTVGGGHDNTASGSYAVVAGGQGDTARGYTSGVLSGYGNVAGDATADSGAVVVGGRLNRATAKYAAVGGGYSNTASNLYVAVGGGDGNTASGQYATIAGGRNNTADSTYPAVGGGYSNTATGYAAVVGGGYSNAADTTYATVGGGYSNTSSGYGAAVGGGSANDASGNRATVGGGYSNTASGVRATVGGGDHSTASGSHATVPGGYDCAASGNRSFAAGSYAKARGAGSFVWSDSCGAGDTVQTTTANRWVARARGGVYFYTNLGMTTGSYLAAGGSSWNSVSDSMTKENFRPVDKKALLETLARMRVRDYNLKSQDASIRHIGPVAQDFHNSFGFGESNTAINMEDADGVLLAAVQALYEDNRQLRQEVEALKAKFAGQ